MKQHQDGTCTTFGAACSGRTCSDSSVLRCGEEVALRDGDGSQAQDAHHYQVDEAGLRRAVEGVVQPGHKGAHDEEGDPAVVQPGHANTKRLKTAAREGVNVGGSSLRTRRFGSYLEKTLETPSEWQYTVWKSQEKERQRMAPRKNIPITTFSWTGATKDMLGRNMYIRPRQRKNRQPAERISGRTRSGKCCSDVFQPLGVSRESNKRNVEKVPALYLAGGSRCFPSLCGF